MRPIPPALAAHLASGATTLARCWRLTRADGLVQGFTDHDRPLVFGGVAHEPAAGFTAGEAPASLGLAVDTAEIAGALVSPALDADDLAAGLYDGASVELFLVNWAAPAERLRLSVGTIGEVTLQGAAFRAEVRGAAHALDQERGRLFAATCDATLGDSRCGVDLDAAGRSADVTVSAVLGPRTFRISGADAVPAGWFSRGRLVWTGGPNAGRGFGIREDRTEPAGRVVELWDAPARPALAGDPGWVSVGCDKRLSTCAGRFGNAANFRGFPHMPGNDFALSVPRRGDGEDGRALA